jgi:maltose alpha-D-glucosyltransferase/alpha-amylase
MDTQAQQPDQLMRSSAASPDAGPDAATWVNDPLWYKDAVIYQLHVKAFLDSNDDGVGDLRGLTSRLDYIKELGVNTVWLLPFYPSPMRDDGYDVADYHNVHPSYGTRNDFRLFVREAHRRGLKVMTELIINHTSDQHPWFQAARRAPEGSPKRDYYVWSKDPAKYTGTRIIFTDTETSNWAWDEVAQSFYWHRFFSHQPDLNFDNPQVLKAVVRTMRFWLDIGVDAFRLDAIPYLVEREGTNNENLPETHAAIRQIRAQLDAHYTHRALLAEANQWPEDVREYFGNADECHMAYHFPLMPRIYMAIAQEDRHPVVDIMQQTPDIPDACQWAIFLRNHDELTLEMVTSKERDYMYRMYAADPRARINLGIRRRLAPLMENDPLRIKLMNSLLLSMPGSPIIYYGDELGMGDNIYLGDRNGVRTPMQWSLDRNGGFSRADPQRLYLPVIMDPVYGYQAVNVEAQQRDPSSLLSWMKRMLAVRKTSRAFGRGRLSFLRPGNRKILAYLREYEGETILCVANLSRSAQPVELDLSRFRGRVPVELAGQTPFPRIGDLPYLLTLAAHDFYWFRLADNVETPPWHEDWMSREDLPVLVLFDGLTSFFRDRVVPWRIAMAEKVRVELEENALPRFLALQRWYDAKGETVKPARLTDYAQWEREGRTWLVTLLAVDRPGGPERYFMPLALAWESDEERMRGFAAATLAKIRQQANVGVLADAFADEAFCRAVVAAIGSRLECPMAHGRLRFNPTNAYDAIAGADPGKLPVSHPSAQSSNTVVTLGDRLFIKGYRKLRPGVNPEPEIGRFLTEVAHFPHCVPIAGTVEYLPHEGEPIALALLQAYVNNQGDGWTYTLDHLQRFLESWRTVPEPPPVDVHGVYLALLHTLALRTAEMHAAFALRTGNPAFDPEPVTAEDLAHWVDTVRGEARGALALLEQKRADLPSPAAEEAQALLAQSDKLLKRIEACRMPSQLSLKTRTHGDYHLGQVLLSKNDFVIIDFEGEPGRGFDERRRKQSPLRDVAGMLRSFNYARWSAFRRAAQIPEDIARLDPLASVWEAEARRVFLETYAEATRAGGLYASFEDMSGLLELFEIEKALYELRYELGSRPDWVRVPLQGLLLIAGAAESKAP